MTERTHSIGQQSPAAPNSEKVPWGLADLMVISQTVFPALLYVPGVQPIRVFLRLGQFVMTLGILFYIYQVQGKKSKIPAHPACIWLILSLGYITLSLLNPETNSFLAAIAQIVMYISVAAPVFWAWALVKSPEHLKRLLWLFLICNGVSCFFGVMQVRDPANWLPREISSVFQDEEAVAGLIYEGVGGKVIIRPPGLSDAPGAVCMAGTFALCAGIILAVTSKKWLSKGLALSLSLLGGSAIFYSLVRTSILISIGMVLTYLLLQVLRGRGLRALSITAVLVMVVFGTYLYSLLQGGDAISERFSTLFAQDPASVYYENRGNQVADGFSELLPKYPLGAGLGRYGMINYYFGKAASVDSPPIWVEIQWNAWLVDGGFVVLFLYPMAVLVTFIEQIKIIFTHPNGDVRELACLVVALNSGVLALCFSFIVFLSPEGIQFWLLSGAIHSVACHTKGAPKKKADLNSDGSLSTKPVLTNLSPQS